MPITGFKNRIVTKSQWKNWKILCYWLEYLKLLFNVIVQSIYSLSEINWPLKLKRCKSLLFRSFVYSVLIYFPTLFSLKR